MEIYSRIAALPAQRRVVAIGAFDGVHAGHREVIGTAVETARREGVTSTVLTFRRHPLAVVDPVHLPRLLTPLAAKVQLLAELGPDELVLLDFDEHLAAMSPDDFATAILRDALGAETVVVGENFTYGHGGKGTPAMLAQAGARLGFKVIAVPLVLAGGKAISSTRIRTLLQRGELEEVRAILGRPPSAHGIVVPGHQRGRTLGFPTANIEVEAETIFPGRGVYAARALIDGVWYRAAVNIGHNPTFQSREADTAVVHVEAFLLDFCADIYGQHIRVDFLHRIREERRFAGPEELIAQLHADVAEAGTIDDPALDAVGLGHSGG